MGCPGKSVVALPLGFHVILHTLSIPVTHHSDSLLMERISQLLGVWSADSPQLSAPSRSISAAKSRLAGGQALARDGPLPKTEQWESVKGQTFLSDMVFPGAFVAQSPPLGWLSFGHVCLAAGPAPTPAHAVSQQTSCPKTPTPACGQHSL